MRLSLIKKSTTALLFLLILVLMSCGKKQQVANLTEHIDAPFDMPQLQRPKFKADTFSITSYGAVSDGITKTQRPFRKRSMLALKTRVVLCWCPRVPGLPGQSI
ncbi:MAG: hypothetical protein HC831_00330 [Chloroflexia bacterium]|nr:hypothetical protein [Chloroflexia bacterium]